MTREEELKRSRNWRIVMTVSSIVIVLIAVFFLVRMFNSNPLEGSWKNEETDMVLTVNGAGYVIVEMPNISDNEGAQVAFSYTIDKENKIIDIQSDEDAIREAAEASDGKLTEEMLDGAFDSVTSDFDYSIDRDELTLTEREYGEQMTFVKE